MLPKDYIEDIKSQFTDYEALLKSFDLPYIKSLRINKFKNPEGKLPVVEDIDKARVKWEERGIYYIEEGDDKREGFLRIDSPGKSPLHAAGAYYIQEASAMLPVTELGLEDKNLADTDKKTAIEERGLKVLDLCASPGGKTTQIADYMQGKGLLVANEIVPSRAKILSENIERMGVVNALVISEDPHKVAAIFPRFFDRILVDAPCSGEGMFRKHPEGIKEWSRENVAICAERQDDILDCAATMLLPTGRIVYSTCTFAREEDEDCIDRFLSRHPEFARVKADEKILPHKELGEGHFTAVLEFKNKENFITNTAVNSDKIGKKSKKNQKNKNEKGEDLSLFYDFCKKSLNKCDFLGMTEKDNELSKGCKDRIFKFGERLFLAPPNMPSLNGISVLRPGLALGKILKGRFEPDHAFALALKAEDARFADDFDLDSQEIYAYLRGGVIRTDGENGWHLITVEGLSLGWGKCAGGCIKNHYPKGLRIQG